MAWLIAEKSLTRVEACLLTGVAGDLKVDGAVDMS